MSVTSGFFNSVNGDRKYTARQMSSLFDGIICDGVFSSYGDAFSVRSVSEDTITVGIGRAWFNSIWVLNDAPLPFELPMADMILNRIDAVVIEVNDDDSVRDGTIKLVSGIASLEPERPELVKSEKVNQYPLAYITRNAGSDAITQSDIVNTIGTSECPFSTGLLQTISIDTLIARWENEFDSWIEGLSAMLDDDTAANLANQIFELEKRFDILASEKTLYTRIEDSNGDDITDSTGSPLLGATVFYSDNQYSPSSPSNIDSDMFKVGDLLSTVRTDLDSRWLLCNGDMVSRDAYPDLAELLPYKADVSGPWVMDVIGLSGHLDLIAKSLVYGKSGFAMVGDDHVDVAVGYSEDPGTGKWTLNALWTCPGIYTNFRGASSIRYLNDTYIICAQYQDSSKETSESRIAYANTPSGNWTIKTLAKSAPDYFSDAAIDIAYGEDGYVVVGERTDSEGTHAISFYGTDLESINSVYVKMHAGASNCKVYGIKYLNQEYVSFGYADGKAYLWHTKTPDSEWTELEIKLEEGLTGKKVACIDAEYIDEKYVLLFTISDSESSSGSVCLLSKNNLEDGNWTKHEVWSKAFVADYETYENVRFLHNEGQYIVHGFDMSTSQSGELKIAYASNLTGPWTTKELKYIPAIGSKEGITNMIYHDANFVFGISFSDTSSGTTANTRVYRTESSRIILPEISVSDDSYTYIKAME